MRHDDTYSDLLWGQKWIPGLYFAWYYIVSAGNKYDKSFVPCKLLEGLLESPKPCRIPALLSFKFGGFFFQAWRLDSSIRKDHRRPCRRPFESDPPSPGDRVSDNVVLRGHALVITRETDIGHDRLATGIFHVAEGHFGPLVFVDQNFRVIDVGNLLEGHCRGGT